MACDPTAGDGLLFPAGGSVVAIGLAEAIRVLRRCQSAAAMSAASVRLPRRRGNGGRMSAREQFIEPLGVNFAAKKFRFGEDAAEKADVGA